jgi:hypothetical protein
MGFPRPKIASVSFYTPPSLLAPKREQIIGGNHPFSPTFLHLFPSNKAPKPPKMYKTYRSIYGINTEMISVEKSQAKRSPVIAINQCA